MKFNCVPQLLIQCFGNLNQEILKKRAKGC